MDDTKSVLHAMKCPDAFIPQGISGGPVLNDNGEVVGTVVRGAVFLKQDSPFRTIHTKIDANELLTIETKPHKSSKKKTDYETVIYFSEISQQNIDCEGNIQLGYRGRVSFDMFDNKRLEGFFDNNGCLSEQL